MHRVLLHYNRMNRTTHKTTHAQRDSSRARVNNYGSNIVKNKTTKNDMLNAFNEIRIANNDERIEKFDGTKAQLQDAIDAYVEQQNEGELTYAQIAREMNVDAKVARGKLRKHGVYASNGRHVTCKRNSALFALYVRVIESKRRDDTLANELHDELQNA